MVLPESILVVVRANIQSSIVASQDIAANVEGFKNKYGAEGDPITFLHGYLVGEITGSAHTSARTLKGSALDDVERRQVVDLIDEVQATVRETIVKIRNA